MHFYFYVSIAAFFVVFSIVAVIITYHDKSAAKKGNWRVKESTLLIVSALGGSIAMLLTMKRLRHKTKHNKFMVGIPLIIVLQIILIGFVTYKLF